MLAIDVHGRTAWHIETTFDEKRILKLPDVLSDPHPEEAGT
jgi:hypothetical protein